MTFHVSGILSQTNIGPDGVLTTLMSLAAFETPLLSQDDSEKEQLEERIRFIQSLASKAVSSVSGSGKKKKRDGERMIKMN